VKNRPVLVDKFISDAIEVDVDALCDGSDVMVCGIMEHIEEGGSTPETAPAYCRHIRYRKYSFPDPQHHFRDCQRVKVIGLLTFNMQSKKIRYSSRSQSTGIRTVPFVSKAQGIPWAKIAAKVMTVFKAHRDS
jgi:carbamoyl-phosphate synthase large subunit